jgi:hypothetical protein
MVVFRRLPMHRGDQAIKLRKICIRDAGSGQASSEAIELSPDRVGVLHCFPAQARDYHATSWLVLDQILLFKLAHCLPNGTTADPHLARYLRFHDALAWAEAPQQDCLTQRLVGVAAQGPELGSRRDDGRGTHRLAVPAY